MPVCSQRCSASAGGVSACYVKGRQPARYHQKQISFTAPQEVLMKFPATNYRHAMAVAESSRVQGFASTLAGALGPVDHHGRKLRQFKARLRGFVTLPFLDYNSRHVAGEQQTHLFLKFVCSKVSQKMWHCHACALNWDAPEHRDDSSAQCTCPVCGSEFVECGNVPEVGAVRLVIHTQSAAIAF